MNLGDILSKIEGLEKGALADLKSLNVSNILSRLQALETAVFNSEKQNMSETEQTIANAVIGATGVAAETQAAVASQGTLLGKIESGLQEFLSTGSQVAEAIDPANAAIIGTVANTMLMLLGVVKSLHPATATPSPTPAADAAQPHG